MNIGRFAVSRPVAVTMRIAALVLLGYICLIRLPIDLLPRVDFPTVAINVSWPNTSPEEMETQITRPIEQAISSVQGLYQISSNSSPGSSFVRAQLDYGTNIDQASITVMQLVQRAKRAFPNDPNISEPTVFKFDPTQMPIISFGVTSTKRDMINLRSTLINEVSPILEAAGGVAQVNISGGQDRAIMVDLDPAKLRAHGIAIADVSRRLQQENISLPAGYTREGNTEYSLRSIGYLKSLDDIRNVPLGLFNGQLVTLGQVATVRDASKDIRSYVRMNGKPAMYMTVTKQLDSNTVDTAKNITDKIAEIEKRYPDMKFGVAYNQATFVKSSIEDLKQTAIIGATLAILIILFFLRNVRSTFVIALSIPTSIISTFALLYFCGFTINTISLSGLALACGLIVDDAIVVLENIYRHIERDKKRSADAAVSGTQEIVPAVVASTFTVMIVFLPLLLIKGQSGQTFTQFALVVVFSLAVSLLDATTVVPMLASRMVKESEVIEEAHPELREERGVKPGWLTRIFDRCGAFFHRLDTTYRERLTWAIHHRLAIVGVACFAVLAAMALWPSVGREQLPQTDSGNLNVRVRLPVGTALSVTDAKMKAIEAIIAKDPEVQTYVAGAGANVGMRGAGGGSPNEGGATVLLRERRKTPTNDVARRLQAQLSKIAGVRAQVSPFDMVANILGGNNASMSVDVYGSDLKTLAATAKTVRDAIEGIPGLVNPDLSVQDASPEVQWSVDREKAQTLGVSFSDIGNTLSAATNGSLSTYYQENGFQYPIYVQVPIEKRLSIEDLKQLPVTRLTSRGSDAVTSSPAQVLLGQVAAPVIGIGPNQIQRQNRQRVINVGGQVMDRPESEVEADIGKALSRVAFPEGTYWTLGTQQLQKQKEYSGLGLSVFLAIALIYMLLASQFESFTYPLVVLTSVPLSAIGMVLLLFLTNRAFGLTAFIGLLMLIGIVVKNGILLVDYTNVLRRRGVPRDEAVLTAAPTRLRPILMTTLAAILGMMPLAIGMGHGSEIYVPLATAVIGGLATSTMLTLFVVPVVYLVVDDFTRRFRKDDQDLYAAETVEPTPASVPGS
ncbi:MAG: efflux RND transporter permease subunit [Armatimonadetes bacterium]|nr:efflux RND transporter permease subunit [Armatimonadota bacterium]